MATRDIVRQLAERTGEDLALYERWLGLCGRQLDCLASPGMEGLEELAREKERLADALADRSGDSARLWADLEQLPGDPSRLAPLSALVEDVRARIGAIQRAEEEIVQKLSGRREDAQRAMGSLRRAGKAMKAYQPIRHFAPRFLDHKE